VKEMAAPKSATLAFQRRFSGDMVQADGEPKVTFRKEGFLSVNRRNQLNWTLTLNPGEERTLNFRYKVLVRH